jgi:hypothetical protein
VSREDAGLSDPVPRLPDWVQAGVSFRQEVGSRDRHILFHIRAVVDEQAVIRCWEKGKGRWKYKCEGWEYFMAFGPSLRVTKITSEAP